MEATGIRADRRSMAAPFFILAFAISWTFWLAIYAGKLGWIPIFASATLLGLLGAFGPTLAAIVVTSAVGGAAGLRGLLTRLLIWRVGLGWYAFALLWPPVQSLVTAAICLASGSPSPDFGSPPVLTLYPAPAEAFAAGPWPLLPMVFVQNLLVGSAMGEELGWRGFALPHLSARWGPLQASLVVGLLWGLWHLPRFLTEPAMANASLAVFVLAILADSVLYGWLFSRTRGSVLLPMLLHASTATTGLFLSAVEGSSLVGALVPWALALVVIRWIGFGRETHGSDRTAAT